MSNEKTTIYLDPRVKKYVQYYALRDRSSLSEIINERLLEYLEDMADAASLEEAMNKPKDDYIPLNQAIKELGFDLNEIRSQDVSKSPKAIKKA